jgi:hypothetical protein
MHKVMATYRDGSVILDDAVDWPNGTRIEVVQVGVNATNGSPPASGVRQELLDALNDPQRYGLHESLWPQTPQEIELLLKRMDAAEPLRMSPNELAAMEAARQAEKEKQKQLTRERWPEAEKRFE